MSEDIISSRYVEYLFAKADRGHVPLSGVFELSPLCNMQCRMCYVQLSKEERDRRGRERTAEEWLSLAEEARREGTLFLLLTGGEPILRPDFRKIYQKLHQMGFLLSINSNGTLITEELAQWLAKFPPMRVNITVYGASNATYGRLCKNPKGFDQMKRGAEHLKKAGIRVKFNVSLTPDNAEDLDGIYDFGREFGAVVQATSYMYPPIRKDADSIGENRRFTAKEAADYLTKIRKTQYTEEYCRMNAKFIKNEMENEKKEEERTEQGEQMRCRAGSSTFWISWKGEMFPCGMMETPKADPFEIGFHKAWEEIGRAKDQIRLPVTCASCSKKRYVRCVRR